MGARRNDIAAQSGRPYSLQNARAFCRSRGFRQRTLLIRRAWGLGCGPCRAIAYLGGVPQVVGPEVGKAWGSMRLLFGMRRFADRRERRRGQQPRGGLHWATISCGGACPCGCSRCRPRSPLPGMTRPEDLFDVAGDFAETVSHRCIHLLRARQEGFQDMRRFPEGMTAPSSA